MAVFNKNSLTQISGFDNQILSGELVWQQQAFWNIFLTNDAGILPLTGASIDAQIIRRVLTNVIDTRNGLSFTIGDHPHQRPFNSASPISTILVDRSHW